MTDVFTGSKPTSKVQRMYLKFTKLKISRKCRSD